jgi:dihydropteroate synthase
MHMQGAPATMQLDPTYRDVVADVVAFLQDRLQANVEVGIDPARVVLDPGIGFGKTSAHNLELLANLDAFGVLGRPLLLGVSRKGLVSRVLGVEDRLIGSLAALCPGICRKAVHVVRVHDVRATRDLVTMLAAIEEHRH